MNNVREPILKIILPHLQNAVNSLAKAQQIAGDQIRFHLFAESQSYIQSDAADPALHHRSQISFFTFFSNKFSADTDYKMSLMHSMANIFAKFNVMHNPRYSAFNDA